MTEGGATPCPVDDEISTQSTHDSWHSIPEDWHVETVDPSDWEAQPDPSDWGIEPDPSDWVAEPVPSDWSNDDTWDADPSDWVSEPTASDWPDDNSWPDPSDWAATEADVNDWPEEAWEVDRTAADWNDQASDSNEWHVEDTWEPDLSDLDAESDLCDWPVEDLWEPAAADWEPDPDPSDWPVDDAWEPDSPDWVDEVDDWAPNYDPAAEDNDEHQVLDDDFWDAAAADEFLNIPQEEEVVGDDQWQLLDWIDLHDVAQWHFVPDASRNAVSRDIDMCLHKLSKDQRFLRDRKDLLKVLKSCMVRDQNLTGDQLQTFLHLSKLKNVKS